MEITQLSLPVNVAGLPYLGSDTVRRLRVISCIDPMLIESREFILRPDHGWSLDMTFTIIILRLSETPNCLLG